ncbi:hypothetical protein KQJ29_33065, partial [Enterococcus sp. S181_ASV_20]|nr:hypothetical protein [Enterococcus sp. S181_ASV_20]
MKLFDIIKSASSNLWRNKGRTVLTVIAIFIGAFTISLTTGVNNGVNDYICLLYTSDAADEVGCVDL